MGPGDGSVRSMCRRKIGRWTFSQSRARPTGVAQQITSQSLQNSINVARIHAAGQAGGESGLSTEDVVIASRRYGNHLGVEFGAAYRSPAVIADGSSPPQVADPYSDYVQTATP